MHYPITTLNQLRPILQGLRKAAGKTQAEVAALLGITQQSYAQFEANPQTASLEKFFKIVQILGGSFSVDVDAKKEPTYRVQTVHTKVLVKPERKEESRRIQILGRNDVNPGSGEEKFTTKNHKKIVVKGDW